MILSVLFSGAAQADFHQPGVLHEGVDTSARGVDETRKPIEEAELQEVKLQKAAERAGEYLEPMVIVSDLMEIASPEIREADLLLKKLTQVIGRIVKEVAFQADRFLSVSTFSSTGSLFQTAWRRSKSRICQSG